jgi:hypothetical protein
MSCFELSKLPLQGRQRGLNAIGCVLICCLSLSCLSGCFEKSYTDRMKVTEEFYRHKDRLNRNLLPEWVGGGYKLRVPIGFELIPPPEAKQPDPDNPQPASESPEELDDPRQPGFLGFRFPGLVAAWQKDVLVDEAAGPVGKKARFYLLSNISLFSVAPDVPGRIDPMKFHEVVTTLLSTDVMTALKEDDWHVEEFPAGVNLVPKVKYQATEMSPERLFEETKLTFKIYLHAEGSTQSILLVVYPTETSSAEKLTERFNFAMETLRAPADPQQAASPAGAGTTAGPAL